MQDRFKFRFWFKDTQEMIYSEKFNDVQTLGQWLFEDRKDAVKMQCTGIKDKNCKLIYEGDIVKDLTYSYNVRYLCVFAPIFGGLGLISIQNWKDYNFCRENWEDYYSNSEVRRLDNRFKLANQGNKLKCFSMRELKMNDFEVIGNVYENPELLKEEGKE